MERNNDLKVVLHDISLQKTKTAVRQTTALQKGRDCVYFA